MRWMKPHSTALSCAFDAETRLSSSANETGSFATGGLPVGADDGHVARSAVVERPAEAGDGASGAIGADLQDQGAAGDPGDVTGDIEATAEYELIASAAGRLASDLVVAPHHGSATSSSQAFVAAARPSYVVYTAGWANRYGFPNEGVDRRWQDIGARALNTASAGTVSFAVDHRSGVSPPHCQRVHARRFWWHVGGSADACHPVSSGHPTEPVAMDSPIQRRSSEPQPP